MIPVYVNCRDRVSHLRELVAWLERAGHPIVLLDNASSYRPLLEFLGKSRHEVRWLGNNLGAKSLWVAGRVPDGPFVFTDPDVIPTEDCPLDAVAYLWDLLERYPQYHKAGLGIHLDDVPADLPSLEWERSLVGPQRELEPGVYDSMIDTTFALYRGGRSVYDLTAIRCGAPYQVRHMPWYGPPSDEDRHYLDHAIAGPDGSSWKQWFELERKGWA